ncbi:MAG: FAD-binding protein [Spirochaetes bacterium]|nr:MAG: FAD-binding protein [Spirochaetota bacterium]
MTRAIESVLGELIQKLGPARIYRDTDTLERYSRDETSDCSHLPDLVVHVQSAAEVSEVMKTCSRHRVPVIPRGTGTGVTGGAIPVAGGLVLSMERMNRIIEIDPRNMTALVEPGAITGDIQRAALEMGLMYPPDPSSLESCSIGGNVAEGAGGPRAVKYGTTKDYILGLECVLTDGSIITTGGKYVKNATGYNLVGILTGSEGTLAVITKILLRLVPAAPYTMDLLIPYESLDEAVEDVFRIISGRIVPAALEFMEEDAIRLVARHFGQEIPFPRARAHLLVQLDGTTAESVNGDLERLTGILSISPERVLVAETRRQSERIWKARRAIREAITKESPVFLAEDTVVPRSEIPPFLREVKSYLESLGLRSIMFGHAGDGNVHIDALKDEIEYPAWNAMLPGMKRRIYEIAIAHGGTITGEHGIGFTRRDYLNMALSHEEIELLRRIKTAFDPAGILNPHKIL